MRTNGTMQVKIPSVFTSRAFAFTAAMALAVVCIIAIAYGDIKTELYRMRNKRITEKLLTAAAEYHSDASAFATVYYRDEDAEYVPLVSRLVDSYYPLLINDFDLDTGKQSFDRTVKVVIYPSAHEMTNGMGINFTILPMGVFYGGVLNILSPREWVGGGNTLVTKNEMIEQGPIIHELAHLALDIKTDGRYPTWFTEGIALYYEEKYIGASYLKSLGSGAMEISFSMLEDDFSALDVKKAYMRAYGVIAFIVEIGGEEMLQGVISDMAEGKSFRKAFVKRTGLQVEILR